ncbi:hypothetical protein Tco_0080257 [Tanacetum coccineum]
MILAHPKTRFYVFYLKGLESVRYGDPGLDTAYWGFLGVGTMLDIFHNIIFILYFQYGVLVFWIRHINFYSFVVFRECRHEYAVSFLMDTVYWSSEAHFESEKEAIHLILTGIGDEIYSTVDACQTAQEMWEAIERLQQASLPTRSHATTRHKGKEIAKPITPPSDSPSDEDSDPEQAQKDKEMQKNLALIAKYLKKLYKPTNNNLRTSSNTRNMNVDTTPRYKNDNELDSLGIRGQ